MDLGANEWTTFRKVTLPLIAPAILASLLLCFAISVDDFVVTYFVAGTRVTFPVFVWGAARVATDHAKEAAVVREANERVEMASLPPVAARQAAPVPRPEKTPPEGKQSQGKKKR